MGEPVVPKKLPTAEKDVQDAIRVLAGQIMCKSCHGTGRTGAWERKFPGMEGKVYHFPKKCLACDGAGYKEDDGVPF